LTSRIKEPRERDRIAIEQEIIDLYDEYTHKPLDRRVFMERLFVLAGSAAAASAALAALEPNDAMAQQVAETDPRIAVAAVATEVSGVKLSGYLARPAGDAKRPGVIVIHENRGLNAHIKDVTRRLATSGFIAFAPDFLTPAGGTPADPDAARDAIGKLTPEQSLEQARAAVALLAADPRSTGRVGAVGFCWGGTLVNRLAARDPQLGAAVVFYGASPPLEDVAGIKAPLLLHYAELDTRINAGVPAYESALKQAGKRHMLHMYAGVNHAFHNDTSAERYDKAAAALAYERTVAFFNQELGG
jgi:carboxymethylenebutenolidase